MSAARSSAAITACTLALILGATIAPTSALAGDTRTIGGAGGAPFRVTCLPGSYIAGVAGSVGAWIDQMSMQCAHWNAQTRHVEPPSTARMPIGESKGGEPANAYCPGGSVVSKMIVVTLRSDNHLVSEVHLICHSLERNDADQETLFRGTGEEHTGLGGSSLSLAGTVECPPNELAVGFYGSAGLFIDALGLICAPAPKGALTAGALGGVSAGHVPLSASAVAKSGQWVAALPSRNLSAGQLGAAQQSSVPAPDPTPAPFDLPTGPTPAVATARGLRHNYPFINDYSMNWGMLDWCRESATNCGAPAANAYCAVVDAGQHPHALEFTQFAGAGRYRLTMNIATRAHCTAKTCAAFEHITCGP